MLLVCYTLNGESVSPRLKVTDWFILSLLPMLFLTINNYGYNCTYRGRHALLCSQVPLTHSLYVPGKIVEADKMLVDVGTGYFVEKNPKKTAEFLERKVGRLCSRHSTSATLIITISTTSKYVNYLLYFRLECIGYNMSRAGVSSMMIVDCCGEWSLARSSSRTWSVVVFRQSEGEGDASTAVLLLDRVIIVGIICVNTVNQSIGRGQSVIEREGICRGQLFDTQDY